MFDNASIHKEYAIHKLLEDRGLMTVTTPPYTPDYNPIERYFRIVKTMYSRSSLLNYDLKTGLIKTISKID